MFQGQSVWVRALSLPGVASGVFEMCFDRQGEAINKLDARTVDEFGEAVQWLAGQADLKGVLVTSAKEVFIVGADIGELGPMFQQTSEEITAGVTRSNRFLVAFEDLPVPTVMAINGFALGGGLELAMGGDLRVMSSSAQVGLPEVKLGVLPGLGGTARLSRLAGPAVACDWVGGGRPQPASAALAAGVIHEVVAPEALRDAATSMLRRAMAGEVDWMARRHPKLVPVAMSAAERAPIFEAALAKAAALAARQQPAAMMTLQMMADAAGLDRAGALAAESRTFGIVTRTQAASSLVQAFLNDQALKKLFKRHAKAGTPVRSAAVLGAGIMGGGIAYTSALRGVPTRMKDIAQPALDLGMNEATKQLARLVKNGKLDQARADAVLASITPQLDNTGLGEVDCVIEAIVENLGVKQKVLAELEGHLGANTVIASNTSSLRIDDIAQPLKRPENFVGMHFFNPVHMMPLVEVIRGSRTSETAVSTAVRHAQAMGKTPIVVADCPGFLVNRIFTAYMRGFLNLVADGADFVQVDRVMEAFGWPMGPAYLQDVVGMDTSSHVNDVISAGYPERMPPIERDALRLMASEKRYGQKNGVGFYRYEADARGKPQRSPAHDTHALLSRLQPQGPRLFTDAEITDRMMLPMIVEAAHALEEGVVGSPAELDTALQLGLGFPAYAGGPLQFADWLGLAEVVARCDRLVPTLGTAVQPTARMREMAARGARFHGT
ncbi:fatty acid oxidation complex subunit alpha FadB [Variovorax sp. KBW07]|uniref:fatty acid oxidation complex subunit alpha FadB n=1 Tax=Variovorax sp. KBW07 TaxID=2153358 RepID=UPI000F584F84|nr:fatty acid oxidation complex subunit alpha FadB [Variovorax sp. KBW07]RQO61033.1 fatty acid oxidation complex subunit alpha FadB [Variovorax sp. KBW07]